MPPTEKTLQLVMNKIKWIYKNEGRPITYIDFIHMYKPSYIRKIFSLLHRRGLIVHFRNIRTHPQGWVPASKENTYTHGGSCQSLLDILSNLDWEEPCIHDFRLKFSSPELSKRIFAALSSLRFHVFYERKDGAIASFIIRWGKSKKRKTQAFFYSSGAIIVQVSCTDDPIPLHEDFIRFLRENLLDLRRKILEALYSVYRTASIPFEEFFPYPDCWLVCQIHFSRDAKLTESIRFDKLPAITYSQLEQTFRLYFHRSLGKLRAEVCTSPNKTFKDFFKQFGLYILDTRDSPSYIC